LREEAGRYMASVRERFTNPYLDHRMADIAQNHVEKIKRRMLALVQLAESLAVPAAQPRLRGVLDKHGLI
jgi:tagaturonate reductase